MEITQILEIAPDKISEYAELENKAYADKITLEEEYKREKAKMLLTLKAEGGKSLPEIDALIMIAPEVMKLKDAHIKAEIDYRAWKIKKEKAENVFQSAIQRGINQRTEMRVLHNTIKE